MRIVHVSHELPPYELAGTAIYTYNIARAQAANHQVFVFARLQDPKVETYRIHDEERDGLKIRFFNCADLEWAPLTRSYQDDHVRKIFEAFLDEVKPDVVHFQHLVGLGMGCIAAVRERGIKMLMTLHDFWAMCPMGQRMCYTDYQICDPIDFRKCGPCVYGAGWQDPGDDQSNGASPKGVRHVFDRFYRERVAATPGVAGRRPRAALYAAARTARNLVAPSAAHRPPESANPFINRWHDMQAALAQCDLLITPSAFLRDEFVQKFGVGADKIMHSANGMDFSYVQELPKTPSPRLRFGFMGSVIKTKGVQVLVDAFLQAVIGRVDIELHVYGAPNRWSGDYFQEQKAKSSHCPYVKFHGRFDNKQVSQVLQNIDVLVLPSIWFENAPLTLNEAAMSRTPILVSDRGGMLEFAQANNYGWTFRLGDKDDLARKMLRIANDRSLVPTLAGNPPRIKPVADNAEELVAIYKRLLDGTWRTPTRTGTTRADTRIEA